MKKAIILALFILTGVSMSHVAYADIDENYSSVEESLGDKAERYTSKTPLKDGEVQEVSCNIAATVRTATNVRSQPAMDVSKNGVIESGTTVQIWGITDNDWCEVYTSADGKNPLFGFIRKNLLFHKELSADAGGASEGDKSQPVSQSQAQPETQERSQTEPQPVQESEPQTEETDAPDKSMSEAGNMGTDKNSINLEDAFANAMG